MPLADNQLFALVHRSVFWADTVRFWRRAPDPMPRRSSLDIAHLLVLALDHLNTCLGETVDDWPNDVAPPAAEFRKHYAIDERFRNWLEHEEEYLAGRGKFRKELGDDLPLGRGVVWAGFGRQTAQAVDVLGQQLDLVGHCDRGEAVLRPLEDWATVLDAPRGSTRDIGRRLATHSLRLLPRSSPGTPIDGE